MQENVPVETYREFMNDIVLEIDREAQIISDLLTLVKTDKGSDSLNIERVDINELMEVILKRLTPLAEKRNIEITFESFREVSADIDKVKFTLAISNLIENGIKYNVDGGWIRVSLNADHKNLYIKVADSGVGIPEDCVEHVFERFYRVDKHEAEIPEEQDWVWRYPRILSLCIRELSMYIVNRVRELHLRFVFR